MKKRLAFLLVLLILFSVMIFPAPSLAHDEYDRTVRVLLSTGSKTTISITVKGAYSVNGTAFYGGTLTATLQSSGAVKLTHSTLGTLQNASEVYIARQDADKDDASLAIAMSSGGVRTYLGDILIKKDSDQSILRVINYVGMHHYLYGAVSGEVSESSNVEILRTQTIAAKGFALAEVASRSQYTFDVYDTTQSQLYIGYVASDVRTIAAVDEVWTQTLLYNGNVVKTHYGTSNGGVILTPYVKWGGTKNYEGAYELKYDPFDTLTNSANVVIRINGNNPSTLPTGLYNALLEAASAAVSGTASSIVEINSMSGFYTYARASYDAPTQFVAELTVTRNGNSNATCTVTLNFDALQNSNVISASGDVHFVAQVGQRNWHLVYGIPSGPRVGMSHRGAIRMASYGYSYVDILKFYYPNATLIAADGSTVPSTNDTSIAAVVGVIYGENIAQDRFYGYVNTNNVDLRYSASHSSASLKKLSSSAPMIVLSKEGEWYYVKDMQQGIYGYLYASYVSAFTKFVAVNEDDTNFRSGPTSANQNVLTVVNTGELLAVYGISGSWYNALILRTGMVGYIYMDLCDSAVVQVPPEENIPTPTPTPVPTPTPIPTPIPTVRPSPTADPNIVPAFLGDVQGDGIITAADAASILRCVVRLEVYNPLQLQYGDIDGDGRITASDAVLILRYIVRLSDSL